MIIVTSFDHYFENKTNRRLLILLKLLKIFALDILTSYNRIPYGLIQLKRQDILEAVE